MATISRGLNPALAKVGFAKEGTPGTASSATYLTPGNVRSWNFPDITNEVIQTYGTGTKREPTDVVQGRMDLTEGGVTFGVQDGWIFDGIMGTYALGDANPVFTHTFTDVLIAQPLTFKEVYELGTNDWMRTFPGCIVSGASFRCSTDSTLECDLSFRPGITGTVPAISTSGAGTSITQGSGAEYHWGDLPSGTMTIGGVATQEVTDFSINITVNANSIWDMGTTEQHLMKDMMEGNISYESTFTLNMMDDAIFGVADNDPQTANTTTVKFQRSANDTLEFALSGGFITSHPWTTPTEGGVTATVTHIAKSLQVVMVDATGTYDLPTS